MKPVDTWWEVVDLIQTVKSMLQEIEEAKKYNKLEEYGVSILLDWEKELEEHKRNLSRTDIAVVLNILMEKE